MATHSLSFMRVREIEIAPLFKKLYPYWIRAHSYDHILCVGGALYVISMWANTLSLLFFLQLILLLLWLLLLGDRNSLCSWFQTFYITQDSLEFVILPAAAGSSVVESKAYPSLLSLKPGRALRQPVWRRWLEASLCLLFSLLRGVLEQVLLPQPGTHE